ncbi:MAG: thiopurine S-methyltransferase [Polyangiales bacterium]
MQPSDWQARWREGKIGFHEAAPNPLLVEHVERLGSPRRVFVPLCGKSRDMAFFASRGARVIGADVSELAAEQFFAESSLVPERSQVGPFEVHAAGGIEFFVGDVFALDAARVGEIDAIYDRAALVALTPTDQTRYASLLASLLPSGGKMLLVTFEYDQSKMGGPPFAVSDARVAELFAADFALEKLGERDVTDERPRFREAGIDRVSESAWLLSRK